jgi:glutamine phosphoribosylpyrophosphate amidotransferase
MTADQGELCVRKGAGLVRDVFQQHHMLELRGASAWPSSLSDGWL